MVRAMLKISTESSGNVVLLVLEGSLSGPWIAELESACQRADIDQQPERIRVDLSEVTFVSNEGKELLERICGIGVEVVSSDLLTKALCEELSKKHRGTRNR